MLVDRLGAARLGHCPRLHQLLTLLIWQCADHKIFPI